MSNLDFLFSDPNIVDLIGTFDFQEFQPGSSFDAPV